MTDDHDTQLAAWKAKHGVTHNGPTDQAAAEMKMHDEEQASKGNSYCMWCGNEFATCNMKLITRRIDPYVQITEAEGDYIPKQDRIRACPPCFKEHHEGDHE